MVSTVLWKAYKLCGGRKRYVVKHGFTEVVVEKPIVIEVERSEQLQPTTGAERSEHKITQI